MSDSSWPLSVGNVTDRRFASFSMTGPWFHMAVNCPTFELTTLDFAKSGAELPPLL